MAVRVGLRAVVIECDVAAVGVPFDADVDRLSSRELGVEIVVEGVPVLAPAVEDFIAVDEDLGIA